MPVPKRKRSRQRRDKRFANKGIQLKPFAKCANCTEAILPHQACKGCGFYKGAQVMTSKADRSVKRAEVHATAMKHQKNAQEAQPESKE